MARDLVEETRARTEHLLRLLKERAEGGGTAAWRGATFEALCAVASLLDPATLRRLAAEQEEEVTDGT